MLHPRIIGTKAAGFRTVSPPEIPQDLVTGWQRLPPDRLGELGVFLWLVNHKVGETTAFRTAAGWNGDVVVAYQKDDRYAGSWKIAWDSSRQANRFRKKLVEVFQQGFSGFSGSPNWQQKLSDPEVFNGSISFEYASGLGFVSWNDDEISMWWGF